MTTTVVINRRELEYSVSGLSGPSYPPEDIIHLIHRLHTPNALQLLDLDETGGEEVLPGIRCVAAGGHTEGSMVIYVETADGLACLCGDILYNIRAQLTAPTTLRGDPVTSGNFVNTRRSEKAAIKRVLNAGIRFLYPSHDGPATIERGKVVRMGVERQTEFGRPRNSRNRLTASSISLPLSPPIDRLVDVRHQRGDLIQLGKEDVSPRRRHHRRHPQERQALFLLVCERCAVAGLKRAEALQHIQHDGVEIVGIGKAEIAPMLPVAPEPRPEQPLVAHEMPGPHEVAAVVVWQHRRRVMREQVLAHLRRVERDAVEDDASDALGHCERHLDRDVGAGVVAVEIEASRFRARRAPPASPVA